MTDIKSQIKHYSSQAVELSKQAAIASKKRDFTRRQTLMKQAYEASQHCQNLIQKYHSNLESR